MSAEGRWTGDGQGAGGATPPAGPRAPVLCASALLSLLLAPPARADDADLCLLAAQDAQRLSGVPLDVLLAITLTETGRGPPGEARPWPWTVNDGAEGRWFPTREEAVAYAQSLLDAGRTSFDVGCFQLNWRWHGANFASLDQMFDPLGNASYAAGYLASQRPEGADWSVAAGAYHSATPEYALRYRAIFDAHRAALRPGEGALALASAEPPGAAPADAPADADAAPRVNSYRLLRRDAGSPRLGSLVPLDG